MATPEGTVLIRIPTSLIVAVSEARAADPYIAHNDAARRTKPRPVVEDAMLQVAEAVLATSPIDEEAIRAELEKKTIEGLLGVETKDVATAKRAFQDHLDSFFLKGWNEALDVVESSVEADDVWPADWRAKYLDPIHMLKALVGRLRKMVWGVPWVWKGEMSDAINEERSRIIAFIKESPSP